MTMDILIKILLLVIVATFISIKTLLSNEHIKDEVEHMKEQLEKDEQLLEEHIKDFEKVVAEATKKEEE